MAEAEEDIRLKHEATFGRLLGPNPELPKQAHTEQGVFYLGQIASDIIGPDAGLVTENLQEQYSDYCIFDDTVVYGNKYLPKIWAGLSYGKPLAILGRLTLPRYSKPALFKRLQMPKDILDDKELATTAHNIAVFAIELSNLVQQDPKFTEQFGQIKNKDKINKNKLAITYGLLHGIYFARNAEPVPTDQRINWEQYV